MEAAQLTQSAPNFLESFSQGVISAMQAMSYWEVIAVILGIAYLVLAMRENSLCWYAAFGSTAIFSWLFFDVSLVMESALNMYYLAMAIYGWYVWNHNPANNTESVKLPVTTWSKQQHTLSISGVVILSLLSGYFLNNHTTAVMPYLDSFTTWGAVLTTYMVAKKILESWIYWIVIDVFAAYMYADRSLYILSLQMLIFVFMCFFGFKTWLSAYNLQSAPAGIAKTTA